SGRADAGRLGRVDPRRSERGVHSPGQLPVGSGSGRGSGDQHRRNREQHEPARRARRHRGSIVCRGRRGAAGLRASCYHRELFEGRMPVTTLPHEKKELSMRLCLALIGALLSFALVASPAAAQCKPDLTAALSSSPPAVLDPLLGAHVVNYYMSLMFDSLVGVTPDGQLSKDTGLATRWEPSADHKRWTFYLRKGVKFHNGDEATSEDVKFSLQRGIRKRPNTGYAGPLRTLFADIETPAPDR